MKKATLIIITLAMLLGASLYGNLRQYRAAVAGGQTGDTVRTEVKMEYRWQRDTNPQLAEERPTGRTVTAHIAGTDKTKPDTTAQTGQARQDSLPELTLNPDSTVTVPITQKVYGDSLYTAYVSGYAQRLDSIRLHIPVYTKTVTVERNKSRNRLHIGIVGGYGYGFRSKQMEPFVGLGLSLEIF